MGHVVALELSGRLMTRTTHAKSRLCVHMVTCQRGPARICVSLVAYKYVGGSTISRAWYQARSHNTCSTIDGIFRSPKWGQSVDYSSSAHMEPLS